MLYRLKVELGVADDDPRLDIHIQLVLAPCTRNMDVRRLSDVAGSPSVSLV